MCGIFGYISKKEINEQIIKEALETLKHRGPNHQGYKNYKIPFGQLCLGHTRLSIQDLSHNAHQPFEDPHQKISLIFNGEIYNFKKIKKQLIQKGYSFKSNSDTEVLLYNYMEKGIDCLKDFNGMFSFILYDQTIQKLFIARDRIGIKPLYYHFKNGNLGFASELKALLKIPFITKEINEEALSLYINCQYIPAPHTILKNTYKLEPGHFITFDGEKLKKEKYWDAINSFNKPFPNNFSEEDALNEFRTLLNSSVSYRTIADVPIGTFLSGGLDSSLITATLAKQSKSPINTFSIGFNNISYDEAMFAKQIANHLKTNHTELYLNPSQTKEMIPQLSHFYDEPFADSSAIPTMIVSKLAKTKVSVCLSGDGGDELFCGYNRYMYFDKIQKIPNWMHPILTKLWEKSSNRLLQKTSTLLKWNKIWDQYLCLGNILSPKEFSSILTTKHPFENPAKKFLTNKKSITENLMLTDLHLYLVDDILTKVDRASMSASLEARVPFLDHRLVEFALRLPLKYKRKGSISKFLIRKLISESIPDSFFNRKKSGFAIPLKEWLKDDLFNWVTDTLSPESIKKHGYFNEKFITKLIQEHKESKKDHSAKIWTLLMFQEWHTKYLK